MTTIIETLTALIDQEARLSAPATQIAARADLYALGLTPFTAIRLMLAVERAFGVEFARDRLNRAAMGSIEAIVAGVETGLHVPEQTLAA